MRHGYRRKAMATGAATVMAATVLWLEANETPGTAVAPNPGTPPANNSRPKPVADEASDMAASNAQSVPVAGRNWVSPATGMEFVWIPVMNMWVGKHEATNSEYRKMRPEHDSGEFEGHNLNGDRQPAVHIAFEDAKAYAKWLTDQDRERLGGRRYRLPTESEWLTFAQCGDGRTYPWGDEWPPPSGKAGNYQDEDGALRGSFYQIKGYQDGFPVTAPVNKLWTNPWGLRGVGGNAWEVCVSDDDGEKLGAWRGASWFHSFQGNLRCDHRLLNDREYRYDNYGFRLVLSESSNDSAHRMKTTDATAFDRAQVRNE